MYQELSWTERYSENLDNIQKYNTNVIDPKREIVYSTVQEPQWKPYFARRGPKSDEAW